MPYRQPRAPACFVARAIRACSGSYALLIAKLSIYAYIQCAGRAACETQIVRRTAVTRRTRNPGSDLCLLDARYRLRQPANRHNLPDRNLRAATGRR